RGGDDGPEDVELDADPHERRDERQRVDGDVREQRPPRHGVRAQPAALMPRLPVSLEQVVANHVGDVETSKDSDPAHFDLRATYRLPALTMTDLRFTKSRTVTDPFATRVVVVAQLSATIHLVPRTVA